MFRPFERYLQPTAVPYNENTTLVSAITHSYGTIRDAYLSHVAIVRGPTIFDLKGNKLYDLKGINIYKLSGELIGHLATGGADKHLDKAMDRLVPTS